MIKHIDKKGISLVEIALAMLIISAAFGSIVTILPTKKLGTDLLETNYKLDKIEKAIYAFYHQNGYIPCPASRTDLKTSANFGVSTNCASTATGTTDLTPTSMAIRIGVVPVRTLNLPDDFMFDSWNMKISYSAVKGLAVDKSTFNTANASPSNPYVIKDAAGTQNNNISTKVYTAYTLLSHGKNRKGAVNDIGNTPIACGTAGLDFENCDDDNTFVDAPNNISPANYYDDYFRARTNINIITQSGGNSSNCSVAPSTFLPTDIYGLTIWLDANDLTKITKDGSNNVSQWTDKSYYVFLFTPTGSNKPVYSATGFNGKPAITFNNKNGLQLTSSTNSYTLPATNVTFFFVGHQSATTNANYILDQNTGTTRFGLNLNMNGSNFWYRQNTTLHSGTTNSNNVYATWVFADGANPEASLYVNGSLVTSNNSFLPLTANASCLKIAESCSSGGPTDFYGEIAEIVLYNRALTTVERQWVESYLKTKWGL